MSKKKINFDGSSYDYLMRNGKFSCGFNMPTALEGEDTYSLPPYAKRMSFLVDKYPACPENWMRSEGILKSFFIPVEENKGMWLDFNGCVNLTHHVAIVISIQGINPITGLPCNDPQMEQYIDECPKHKIKFGADRYCKKCDFRWPKQNYICTTGTPEGYLWLDGFRAADGIVRQYILTAEKMRGVASNVIGKDRVYAIGLSFFLSKDKKPEPITHEITIRDYSGGVIYNQPQFFSPIHTPINWDYNWNTISDKCTTGTINYSSSSIIPTVSSSGLEFKSIEESKNLDWQFEKYENINSIEGVIANSTLRSVKKVKIKNLEIGAGAKINQNVYDDPEKLDFWHNEPESIICINYCSENEARKIIEGGIINVEGSKEGFLRDTPVGN